MSRLSARAVVAPIRLTIVVELESTGNPRMSSFHGLFAGRIWSVEAIASAWAVCQWTLVMAGVVPRTRPSWFVRGEVGGTPRNAPPVGLLRRNVKLFPPPAGRMGIETERDDV